MEYYKSVIDGEEVLLKNINKEYQLEISGYKNKKINLYLWKDKRIIVGRMIGIASTDTIENYEKILIKECIEKGNELDYDFKNMEEK